MAKFESLPIYDEAAIRKIAVRSEAGWNPGSLPIVFQRHPNRLSAAAKVDRIHRTTTTQSVQMPVTLRKKRTVIKRDDQPASEEEN